MTINICKMKVVLTSSIPNWKAHCLSLFQDYSLKNIEFTSKSSRVSQQLPERCANMDEKK